MPYGDTKDKRTFRPFINLDFVLYYQNIALVLVSHLPSTELQDLVKEYYFIHLESEDKSIPVIDDCSYDLVCFKEGTARLSYNTPPEYLSINHQLFTIHNLIPPYQIHFQGSLTFFTIKLQPWVNGSLFSILDAPGIFDISSLIPKSQDLVLDIFKKSSTDAMFQYADEFMSRFEKNLSKHMTLTKQVCSRIMEKRGLISVNVLSDEFGKSRQYLNKIFKQQVLYGLKKYIITVRILDLIKYKRQHPELSLTALAHHYEYFDQAHFINDFKKVCGIAPKAYFNNLPEFLLRHE